MTELKKAPWVINGAGPQAVNDITPDNVTMNMLVAEVRRARTKFPGRRYLLAALVEEVGELAEALVDGDPEEIRKEAIQCACVAIRIAEEGDGTTYGKSAFLDLVVATGNVARGLLQRVSIAFAFALDIASRAVSRMKELRDRNFDDITDEEAKP